MCWPAKTKDTKRTKSAKNLEAEDRSQRPFASASVSMVYYSIFAKRVANLVGIEGPLRDQAPNPLVVGGLGRGPYSTIAVFSSVKKAQNRSAAIETIRTIGQRC